jgi:hypothetical protein
MAIVLAPGTPYSSLAIQAEWDRVFEVNKVVFSQHFAKAIAKLADDAFQIHFRDPSKAPLEVKPFDYLIGTNLFEPEAISKIWFRIHPQILEYEPFCSWFENLVLPYLPSSQEYSTSIPKSQFPNQLEYSYYHARMAEINQLAVEFLTKKFNQGNAFPENDLIYTATSFPGAVHIRIEKRIKPIKQPYTENQRAAGQLIAVIGLVVYAFFTKSSILE